MDSLSLMEEAKDYDTEAEKEGVGSSEVPIFDEKHDFAVVVDHDPVIVLDKTRRLNGPARRSSKANWTEEEDCILGDAVQKYQGKNWRKVAACLPGRTDVQCLHRWQKVLNPDLIKGPWSEEEDRVLVELVDKFSEKKWSVIAEQLPGRMGKQCRERWHNHLKPEIKKSAWTDEEERILINAHDVYGNKWSALAKLLPGRTENSVKNHWNCSLKKKLGSYSSRHPSSSANVNNSSKQAPSTHELTELSLDDPSKSLDLATSSQTKALSCNLYNSIRPRRHSDVYDKVQSSSHWSYPGLCYEPLADLNVLTNGKSPSPISCACQPNRSMSAPPSRSYAEESSSDFRKTIARLRSAAMSYGSLPSIIRKRANQGCLSVPAKAIGSSERTDGMGDDDDDDEVVNLHNCAVFSPKYQKVEKFDAIKSVGKCLEREFFDA